MQNNFSGTLAKYYKRDETTGYSYVGIDTGELDVKRNSDGYVYIYGIIPKWPIGTTVILKGEWTDKFIVKTIKPYTETLDTSKKLLKDIVCELKEEDEAFKLSTQGIKKILAISGPDILTFIKDKNALNTLIKNLPKIEPDKLKLIYERLIEINESYRLLDYIIPFGGTIINCNKLLSLYGASALRRLKRHPYKIGYKAGFDFYTMDRIGKDVNFDPLDMERLESLAYTTLNRLIERNGSTYVTQYNFKRSFKAIHKKSSYGYMEIPDSLIAIAIQNASGIVVELVKNGSRLYKRSLYTDEKQIVFHLSRLNERKKIKYDESKIEEIENELKIKYSDKQKEAFHVLKTTGVKIITGGPGTGKTTLINGILLMYQKMFPRKKIKLCAPTGRAAQRLSEVTGMDANTIHRLLEFQPFANDEIQHKDADDPIDADLLVLDEMSMVDTEIFALLLQALKKDCIVLLVGDENQLQSVSPGNVLHDLIESHQFEMYRLKKIYRQINDSSIIDNAYEILNGGLKIKKDSSFKIYEYESLKEAAKDIIQEFYKFKEIGELNNTLILTPTNVGTGGTFALNKIIANEINEDAEAIFTHRGITFHLNDRVIFHKNNYEKDYYNGDMGVITEILKNGFFVQVQKKNIRVTGEILNDVTLAYSISIHKSQGSEANNVLILLPDTNLGILNRKLLFTAITRAKKFVKIVYVNDSLFESVHNIKADSRNTGLEEKLKGIKYMTLSDKK